MMRLAAALVHLFTALGAVCALFAALAIADRAWETVFFWLGLAFLIDGIDGTFARMVNVGARLPRFSGDRLDLVVDYVTYVFVPVLAMMAGNFLSGPLGLFLAAVVLVSSLYHFADLESKADDFSFVGFPAIWNIVAFYFFVFSPPSALGVSVVAIFAALTFVPLKWVHPLRVTSFRMLTLAACIAWSVAGLAALWWGFDAVPLWAEVVLLGVAVYGLLLAVVPPFVRRA